MNSEKLTDRSKGFIQAAQNLAVRLSNPYVTPIHLLKVMTEDENGLANNL